MRWVLLALVLLGVGCGNSESQRHRKTRLREKHPTEPMNASADREHPVEFSTLGLGGAHLPVRTPSAGSWWFGLTVGPIPDGMVADDVATIRLLDPAVTLSLVEGRGVQQSVQRIDLPEPSAGRYLVRVDTPGPAEFSVWFSRGLHRAPPPPPAPECDIAHIDPSNPNCAGAHPPCDRRRPDYKNPHCCEAKCEFGRLQCTTVVTKVNTEGKYISFDIGIGSDLDIMYGARARIHKGTDGATGIVMGVSEHSSWVVLDDPGRANLDKLLGAPVVLAPPAECDHG